MRRWLSGTLQAIGLLVITLAIYAWQARDLLPAGERVAAPAFELVDTAGRRLTTADLSDRPTILYFFAPWCRVCAVSAPQLRWFDRWFGDSARIVLVALDYESAQQVVDYGRRHALRMPLLLGDPAVAADYHVRGYPTYYVLDAEGRVAGRDFGASTIVGLWWRTRGLEG